MWLGCYGDAMQLQRRWEGVVVRGARGLTFTENTDTLSRPILPTCPGRGDARGAHGGLETDPFVKSELSSSQACNKPRGGGRASRRAWAGVRAAAWTLFFGRYLRLDVHIKRKKSQTECVDVIW